LNSGRSAVGIDLNEAYCAHMVKTLGTL
jgi:hypothetical protein